MAIHIHKVATVSNRMSREILHSKIYQHYNLEELRLLAFELDIPYEDLEGMGKNGKIVSLIEHTCRYALEVKLKDNLKRDRPNAKWDQINWETLHNSSWYAWRAKPVKISILSFSFCIVVLAFFAYLFPSRYVVIFTYIFQHQIVETLNTPSARSIKSIDSVDMEPSSTITILHPVPLLPQASPSPIEELPQTLTLVKETLVATAALSSVATLGQANTPNSLPVQVAVIDTPVPTSTPPTLVLTGTFTPVPTNMPTLVPTNIPTVVPTNMPTLVPTNIPTVVPTNMPTVVPTNIPTVVPTNMPTVVPTNMPTLVPTNMPTLVPTSTSIPPLEVNWFSVPPVYQSEDYRWENLSESNGVIYTATVTIGGASGAIRRLKIANPVPKDAQVSFNLEISGSNCTFRVGFGNGVNRNTDYQFVIDEFPKPILQINSPLFQISLIRYVMKLKTLMEAFNQGKFILYKYINIPIQMMQLQCGL